MLMHVETHSVAISFKTMNVKVETNGFSVEGESFALPGIKVTRSAANALTFSESTIGESLSGADVLLVSGKEVSIGNTIRIPANLIQKIERTQTITFSL